MLELQAMESKISQLAKEMEKSEIEKTIRKIRLYLGYDPVLYNKGKMPEFNWFLEKKEEKKNLLGQISTPPEIAKLIAKLCIHSYKDKIIDPCFGEGIFLISSFERLNELANKSKKIPAKSFLKQIYGVELDPQLFLIGLRNFMTYSGISRVEHNFFNGDFFDLEGYIDKFDVGIMNPPYVRQEDLSSSVSFLNKSEIRKKCLGKLLKISNKSNLYVYFFVHLTKFLKDGGWLGAITSNTWLDTDFGRDLQAFFLDNYSIKYVIDFSKDVFPNASVESCIIIMQKRSSGLGRLKKRSYESITKFIRLKKKLPIQEIVRLINSAEADYENEFIRVTLRKQKDLRLDHKWGKYFYAPRIYLKLLNSEMLVSLSTFANICRGLTTHCNNFFMPARNVIEHYGIEKEYLRGIIKSPKDIEAFDTKYGAKMSEILIIDKDKNELKKLNHIGTLEYINDWEKKFLAESKRSFLINKILKRNNKWFILKSEKSAPIIFSYILRKSKSFLLNSPRYLVQDNFYMITPKKQNNEMLLFGILNSTFTKVFLEMIGRKHGRGLLKVQVYELKSLPVLNIAKIPSEQRETIVNLSRRLSKLKLDDTNSQREIIHKLDSVILDLLDVDVNLNELIDTEEKLVKQRLSRKKVSSISEIIDRRG